MNHEALDLQSVAEELYGVALELLLDDETSGATMDKALAVLACWQAGDHAGAVAVGLNF